MIIKKEYLAYKNLTKVIDLNLSNENVESIDLSTFQGLFHLRSINLESNFIKSIDAALFRGITL